MRALETIRIALEAVRHNRLRSLLTVLGIGIGIASVTLTVGLGSGASQTVQERISSLGTNLLVITPGSSSSGGFQGGRGSATTLTFADAEALANKKIAPDIGGVAPVTTTNASFVADNNTWTTSLVATTPDWLTVRNRTIGTGRFLTAADEEQGANVVVLGTTTATELFNSTDVVGREVSIGSASFTVVGVLASQGSSTTTDEDDQAIIPATAGSRLLGMSATTVSSIYLAAASSDQLSAAYYEAEHTVAAMHGVTLDNMDFSLTSQQSLLDTATSTTKTLTVLLGGVAAISLLVGGIGVMNIMLVSVTERTREIGLRKALGATPGAIRRQFLTEASVLGLAGGVGGLAVGIIGAIVLPKIIGQALVISPAAIGGSLAVAIGVGIVAGVYPASRAARLAPIDALRHE